MFKDKHRDPKTGTPHGAPLARSKMTLFMMIAITLMLLVWLLVTIVISLPLVVVFFPVVIVFGFFIPFLGLWIPQKLIYWFKKMGNVKDQISTDNLAEQTKIAKPASIEETVFSLKASTTQLLSVLVLAFVFLPIYDNNSDTWTSLARDFLSFIISMCPN